MAASFTFDAIDTTGFTSILGSPVINDNGQVAFIGQRTGDTGKGYFISDNGAAPVRVSTTNADLPGHAQINNAGQIAYTSFYNGAIVDLHRASLAGGDELLAHATSSNFSGYTYFGNNAMIDSAGDVTTVARRFDHVNFTDLRAFPTYSGANNSVSEPITTASGPYASFTENYPTFDSNDNGDLAFTAQLTTGGQGVFLKRNGTITTIINDPTNAYGFINEVSLNNQGHAMIYAESNNHPALFIYDGNSLTPYVVADGAGGFNGLNWSAFNDHDEVAFMGGHTYSNEGIWIGTDIAADEVIKMGDPLLGSTVKYLSFWPGGLNNNGQLAFYAQLNDGRSLMIVATPAPEPTAGLALLALATGGLLARRRRRRRGITRRLSCPSVR
jgi:hypothetical protein